MKYLIALLVMTSLSLEANAGVSALTRGAQDLILTARNAIRVGSPRHLVSPTLLRRGQMTRAMNQITNRLSLRSRTAVALHRSVRTRAYPTTITSVRSTGGRNFIQITGRGVEQIGGKAFLERTLSQATESARQFSSYVNFGNIRHSRRVLTQAGSRSPRIVEDTVSIEITGNLASPSSAFILVRIAELLRVF